LLLLGRWRSYLLQLIGATQLIVGLLLILNRFVPLALAQFAPFIINNIQTGMTLAGLAAAFTRHVSGATEQWADRDEGGRQVTLKPISQIRLLGGALAGIGLLV